MSVSTRWTYITNHWDRRLENQARFDARLAAFQARFEAGIEELRKNQAAMQDVIDAFIRAGQAQIELHQVRFDSLERRMDTQEREFKAFLDRFDTFLRGQGNGHAA